VTPSDLSRLSSLMQTALQHYLLLLTNVIKVSSITGLTVGEVLERLNDLYFHKGNEG